MLLLYILSNQDELKLSDDNVEEIVNLLINFFVRRNLTDIPNTRKLTQLFIDIITDIKNIRGTNIISVVHSKLKEVSASDAVLEEKLNGAIYDENPEAARYVLCTVESQIRQKKFILICGQEIVRINMFGLLTRSRKGQKNLSIFL